MALRDFGNNKFVQDCVPGGTGSTAITKDTKPYLLVTASKAVGTNVATVKLTSAATELIHGTTRKTDENNTYDIYAKSYTKRTSIDRSNFQWVEAAAAYVAADFGKGIVPDDTNGNEGFGKIVSTGGVGRVEFGITEGTQHFLGVYGLSDIG